MRALFLIVLYAGLCYASSGSDQENIETLMDNVLVLRVYSLSTSVYVPLSCGEAYQNQPVVWKKNGKEIEPALQGNQVKVLVEEMNGGNYTCHLGPDGEYLNHTVILIQLDPDNRTVILEEFPGEGSGHIYCSSPNYNGSFHCTWRRSATRSNAAVLLVKAERNSEIISCELDADGSGILCKDANCPYKEEQHRVSITIYIHSYSRLEAYTRTFYLREIVRPEKLPNLRITNGKVFSWNYPESWEMPCSYFGLQYEVKMVQKGFSCHSKRTIMNETIETRTYEVKIKPNKYVFCVRAQDKHTKGPFSHWSHCIVDKHTEVC